MQWISVDDMIPAAEKNVLVTDTEYISIGYYSKQGSWVIYPLGDYNGESFTPIFWMSLPKMPFQSPYIVECHHCDNVEVISYKYINDWKCGYCNPLKEK